MTPEQRRFLRFCVSGLLVAITYVCLFTVLSRSGLTVSVANVIAFGIAIAVQYILQTRWTFQKDIEVWQSARFLTVVGFGFLFSTVITTWVGPALGWVDWVAAGFTAVALPIFNYISFRLWVYRAGKAIGDGA